MDFNSYSRMTYALTFEEMQEIYSEMQNEIGDDTEAAEIYGDLLKKAVYYTGIRAEWGRLSREEKLEKDPARTAAHDSVINHFDMLASYLKMQGKPASWRDRLGYEAVDRCFRKRLGDMANYIVFIEALLRR